tara:strand:- start:202 stop:570 length:369 start_codon:yes stop_codon:yes gene_type:complete
MIIFQSTVKKLDIEINRGIIYLMSDNDKHEGDPLLHADNVLGIRLKKTHGSSESAFWLDSTYESNIGKVDQDLKVVKQSMERGGLVVYSPSLIGYEIPKMKTVAPKTADYIQDKLLGTFYVW